MEAPERNKPLLLCQRCFAIIPDAAEFCTECGAPVVDDLGEGSDTAVYPELARANLLRMRGEYKIAEDICLAILRKHPNSATANTILGDICAEKGDLKQAAEWFEMALDITPDSTSDRDKLINVRRRIKEHETAETAKHLGLPESRPKVGLWVGGVIAFVALVAAIGFLLGERMNANKNKSTGEVTVPVSVPLQGTRNDVDNAAPNSTTPPAPTDLLSLVKAAVAGESARILGATRFPDTQGVLLTFSATGSEDLRLYAAQLGKSVLEKVNDAPNVTLLALRDGKVAYSATMTRQNYTPTTTEEWKAQHADDLRAFADAALTDEWPPPTPPSNPSSAPPAGESGGATGG